MQFTRTFLSPAGPLLLESDGSALTALRPGRAPRQDSLPLFDAAQQWLSVYFSGRDPGAPGFPLRPAGTAFQTLVWGLLEKIPYGRTCSYGELAARYCALTGAPAMSAQAIGSAVGKNPIAIVIPCHRVLGSRGQLTGYAYGLNRKRQLLALEGIPVSDPD